MSPMRRVVSLGVAAAACAAVTDGCKEPTQVTIDARTDVPYRAGVAATFTVGAPGRIEGADPTTESRAPWGSDGRVGTLVVIPAGANDAELAVKLVLAIGRDPRECSAVDSRACIVARRRLRYVPSTPLRLPIVLYSRCEGVPCAADTTCNYLGQCVSAEVDAASCTSAEGCLAPGDPPRAGAADGGVTDDADATGRDAADDGATADGGVDASSGDAAADGGGTPGGTPGYVACTGAVSSDGKAGSCKVPEQECCIEPGFSGQCVRATGAPCPVVGMSQLLAGCDGREDCGGQTCCAVTNGESGFLRCAASCDNGAEVCHSDGVCATGACTGVVPGSQYRTCR
jgi:hypothetical protein